MTFRYDDKTIIEKGDQVRIVKPGAELSSTISFPVGPTGRGYEVVRVPLPVGSVLTYSGQGSTTYSSWGTVPFFSWLDESGKHHYGRLPEISDHPQVPPRTDKSFYEVVE